RVRARHAEVNQHDDHGNRQPVADDGEGPGVARVALVDEPAHRAALEVMREAGKDRALAAVRASLAKAAAERGANQLSTCHATSAARSLLHGVECDVEDEGGIRRNRAAALTAVGELRRNHQPALTADAHPGDSALPSLNHPACADHVRPEDARVELRAL